MPRTADWEGNNLAVTCPVCGKVFLASGSLDQDGRKCPVCRKSTAYINAAGTEARVEWEDQRSDKVVES